MNHPTREEWMSYLYDEVPAATKATLAAHLQTCPACQTQMAGWRGATQALDEWVLPARPARRSFTAPLLRWSAAAAVVLLLGFGAARMQALSKDVAQLRAAADKASPAALEERVRQQLRAEFQGELQSALAAVVKSGEETRLEDYQTFSAALRRIEATQTADHATLRKELETVAVLTEDGLVNAQQQIVNLANLNPPVADAPKP